MDLRPYVREIEGFPREGISFKDITPLLADPEASGAALRLLVDTAEAAAGPARRRQGAPNKRLQPTRQGRARG